MAVLTVSDEVVAGLVKPFKGQILAIIWSLTGVIA